MANNFDDMKLAVEMLSGGKNTVLFDDVLGMPSIMVVINKMLSNTLLDGATQTEHPAFIMNDVIQEKVAWSKYHNIIRDGHAYSLPMQDPKVNINWQTAQNACRANGEGWGLTPYALYGAVALWSWKNGTMPHGNSNYGADEAYPHERGATSAMDGTKTGRTATGSGPAAWTHDHTPFGVCDLKGDVWDWCAGSRVNDSEINIIPYADCMNATCDMSENSSEWKAIMPDGTLVAPGTAGTLKYDYVNNKIVLCTSLTNQADAGRGGGFESMGYSGITEAPQILKELGFAPPGTGLGGDYFYMNNTGERFPLRGGSWGHGANAGVFDSAFYHARSSVGTSVGFRSAFYGKL